MAEEIVRNIWRIPVPLPDSPLRELNAYLIRGEDRSLLIDTGFRLPPCRQAVEEGLAQAGADRTRLDVVCTHIHTDHTGQADDLAGPGRTIYIGAGDYPMTRSDYDRRYWAIMDDRFLREGFPPEELRAVTAINPALTLGPPKDLPMETLEDGDVLTAGDHALEVIAVPGHTPGRSASGWPGRGSCSRRITSSSTSLPTSPCGPTCPTPWAGIWRAWSGSDPSR